MVDEERHKMKPELIKKSKFLSLVLRHNPTAAGIELDPNGWVQIDLLLKGAARMGKKISSEELEQIVKTNEKSRFEICEVNQRIRARQGHSVIVDLGLTPSIPTGVLFHGTSEQNWVKIRGEGISRMTRHHVHLSDCKETATAVGRRHGKACVLTIETALMVADAFEFFKTGNGVWLVEAVPVKYIKKEP